MLGKRNVCARRDADTSSSCTGDAVDAGVVVRDRFVSVQNWSAHLMKVLPKEKVWALRTLPLAPGSGSDVTNHYEFHSRSSPRDVLSASYAGCGNSCSLLQLENGWNPGFRERWGP